MFRGRPLYYFLKMKKPFLATGHQWVKTKILILKCQYLIVTCKNFIERETILVSESLRVLEHLSKNHNYCVKNIYAKAAKVQF